MQASTDVRREGGMGGRQDSVLKSRRMDGIVPELREQKEAGTALIFTMEQERPLDSRPALWDARGVINTSFCSWEL